MGFKKHLGNGRGMVTIGMALVIGILMIAALQAFSMTLTQKTKALTRRLHGLRQAAIFDMIASRVSQELKQRYQDSTNINKVVPPEPPPGSLNFLLRSTSRIYSPAYPRRFGKGQFQIDLINGGPTTFVAPESDITAVLSPTIGNGYYLVTVRTSLCREQVVGRVRFAGESPANPTPGLGVAWVPACPAGQVVPVTYTFFVNINSVAFNS